MLYTFARVGAVLQMNVGDYFTQGRRGRVRLHEKGGVEHEAQCHHNLETYLDEYIAAPAGIADDRDGPLFRTTGRLTGTPHRLTQPDALPHDPPAGQGGRDKNRNRQSLDARHGHHGVLEKRRHAGTCAGDGRAFLGAHHATSMTGATRTFSPSTSMRRWGFKHSFYRYQSRSCKMHIRCITLSEGGTGCQIW